MLRRPPRSTRTNTLVTDTTLVRSLDTIMHHLNEVTRTAITYPVAARCTIGHFSSNRLEDRLYCRPGCFRAARHDRWPQQCAFFTTRNRSEEHTSELQSLMRNSYAVFCLQKKKKTDIKTTQTY